MHSDRRKPDRRRGAVARDRGLRRRQGQRMPVARSGEQRVFDLVLVLRVSLRLRPDVADILGCAAELEELALEAF
jgi:hypothetical protein